jgi:DNA-3-methyladenine glycosylase
MKRSREQSFKLLEDDFYKRDTLTVAKELVGKVMQHTTPKGVISVIINETEAYTQDEASCHAFSGKSDRNRAMFMEGGHIYIYKIYGMHRCINFVTEYEGRGCAVLLRGVLPLESSELLLGTAKNVCKLLDGPAKLMKNLSIPFEYYGMKINDESCPIKIYESDYEPLDLKETPRIGISRAQDLPWRFIASEFTNYENRRPNGRKKVIS